MATVMMSILLTCTYVGQIPFGDKILPIQRTCVSKPSLYCFSIDMGHPWDFEESVLERTCTLGLSRGNPRVESRRGDNDGNPWPGQEIRSGIQEVRNKTNSTCVTHLEFSGGIEKKSRRGSH